MLLLNGIMIIFDLHSMYRQVVVFRVSFVGCSVHLFLGKMFFLNSWVSLTIHHPHSLCVSVGVICIRKSVVLCCTLLGGGETSHEGICWSVMVSCRPYDWTFLFHFFVSKHLVIRVCSFFLFKFEEDFSLHVNKRFQV